MSTTDDRAFFATLEEEIRQARPQLRRRGFVPKTDNKGKEVWPEPCDVVRDLRAIARHAVKQCCSIIKHERSRKPKRAKVAKKYGQARRRKNSPYDQAGATLTVMLAWYGLSKPALWAARVLWHSRFRCLAQQMDVVNSYAKADPGKEDVTALMRWGRFEREKVRELENLMRSLPEEDARRQGLQGLVETHKKTLKEKRSQRLRYRWGGAEDG